MGSWVYRQASGNSDLLRNMLTIKQQPPSPAWVFEFQGITFRKEGEEPFLFSTPDKKADLDPSRKGWVNRIMRYAKANNLELDEQDIYQAVQKRIAGSFRNRYFTGGTVPTVRASKKFSRLHSAPIPPGLMTAARRKFGAVVEAEDDAEFLHSLSAKDWLVVLGEWKAIEPDFKDPEKFGPIYWWCIHSLGITMDHGGFTNVRQWITLWQNVPCPDCRNSFHRFTARRPISWTGLARWADKAHQWVSESKNK